MAPPPPRARWNTATLGEDDLPDRERHDQRVQPQDPDEDPVDQSDEDAEAEAGEDRDPEAAVVVVADADDQVAAEEHHPRGREIDARVHDHQHLAERRNGEHGHVRQDEGPRRALQRLRRDDLRHQEEHSGREPDRQEARSDQCVGEQRGHAATRVQRRAPGADARVHPLL
jgi:hypothetical protein